MGLPRPDKSRLAMTWGVLLRGVFPLLSLRGAEGDEAISLEGLVGLPRFARNDKKSEGLAVTKNGKHFRRFLENLPVVVWSQQVCPHQLSVSVERHHRPGTPDARHH